MEWKMPNSSSSHRELAGTQNATVPRSGSIPMVSGRQVDALGNILELDAGMGVGIVVLLLTVLREQQ